MAKSWAARLSCLLALASVSCRRRAASDLRSSGRLPQQELFVAQVLIKKVKLKCCGIWVEMKVKNMNMKRVTMMAPASVR